MNSSKKALRSLVGVLCLLLTAGAVTSSAQTVTTGSLTGVVTDAQGGALPGATVVATHTSTGTTYEGISDNEGRFNILNMRVGPYTVAVTMSGFKKEERPDVAVVLGEQRSVEFKLVIETLVETVDVIGQLSVIDSSRAGTAQSVSQQVVDSLPSINRSIYDLVKVSPYFSSIGLNADPQSISVAGRNNRYNNVQIDGAVNNDVFGLADSGVPGGQTETQPVSLDAIQELQLVVSPYDVRQGGFSGGGINAITKSGTNNLRGTGYYYGRNNNWVGESPTGVELGDMSDQQMGASLGGRIVPNKAFFFGNVDIARRETGSGASVSGTGQVFGREADVDRFISILQNRYGYNPGGKDEFQRQTDSNKWFIRTDFNVANGHQLTVRNNYISALNDIGRPDPANYFMPDAFYRFETDTNSFVTQLNSTFGTSVNEFRVTYQRQRDRRGGQPDQEAFPFVRVFGLSGGASVRAGTENFSTANELNVDVIEVTDDFSILRGKHTITFGTHNEFFSFRNLFIRDLFGNYTFDNLNLFEQGLAQSYDHSFSNTSDPLQAAEFGVHQWGFYFGDQWRALNRLTLTTGLRVDIPRFPDTPTANPAVLSTYGFATDVVPDGVQWSPRVGFNYDISGNATEQVRGGIGLFTGRTPYVWLSNQYGNTGIEFTRVTVTTAQGRVTPVLFNPDPNNPPKTVAQAATNEISLIDPDYKYPSLIRGNIAYDRELGIWGLIGTAEFLYSTVVKDIKYQNVNLVLSGQFRQDGRPIFTRVSNAFSNAILLENTDQGDQWSINFQVQRPFRNGFTLSGSYLYGESTSILDGTSSQAASNWGNLIVPGDVNNPPLTRSNFDPGHRITIFGAYQLPLGGDFAATASLFYVGQSGRPFNLTSLNQDINGDTRTNNDSLYLPVSADEVTFTNGTFADWQAFINGEECYGKFLGQIIPRNACRAPWTNQLDFKFNVQLPYKRVRTEVTFDLLNMFNLFDRESGLVEFANFNSLQPAGVTVVNGRYNYNIAAVTGGTAIFLRDDLRSRWQMQLGARVRF
jgi:Carboxypeptidase regulatory-like domain